MEDTNLKTEEVVTEEKEIVPTVEQTAEEKEPEEKVEESKTETEKDGSMDRLYDKCK